MHPAGESAAAKATAAAMVSTTGADAGAPVAMGSEPASTAPLPADAAESTHGEPAPEEREASTDHRNSADDEGRPEARDRDRDRRRRHHKSKSDRGDNAEGRSRSRKHGKRKHREP